MATLKAYLTKDHMKRFICFLFKHKYVLTRNYLSINKNSRYYRCERCGATRWEKNGIDNNFY